MPFTDDIDMVDEEYAMAEYRRHIRNKKIKNLLGAIAIILILICLALSINYIIGF